MTPNMKRTSLYLTVEEHAACEKEAKRTGKTVSDVVRGLIDVGLLHGDDFAKNLAKRYKSQPGEPRH